MHIVIGEIAKEGKIVLPSTICEEVYDAFENDSSLEGIIVCEGFKPIGLVMKTHFFHRLSTKYGFDLFMKRTIDRVMDHVPLIVDYSLPITEVSSLAMSRKVDNLYDLVIVTKNNKIFGAVSIRELIMKLAEVQIRNARFSSPLTGLPGNIVIKEMLEEVLTYKMFSVLYIDIDSFKAFNDTYGFSTGDEIIKETATILTDSILTKSNEPSFVGHIGGDDFIATIPHYCHKEICDTIINRFHTTLEKFYVKEDIENGYVKVLNRQGILEQTPLVSISIAVIQNINHSIPTLEQLSKEAAKVKRSCKAIRRSIYLTLEEYDKLAAEKTHD
ncbi:GGDEF domain-containing protein [Fredinandcohnia humi]